MKINHDTILMLLIDKDTQIIGMRDVIVQLEQQVKEKDEQITRLTSKLTNTTTTTFQSTP